MSMTQQSGGGLRHVDRGIGEARCGAVAQQMRIDRGAE
jgi:hypothetical protein